MDEHLGYESYERSENPNSRNEVHGMKDVNDLMQAILEMDAAQRKASEKAKAERTARLAALDVRKQAIAAECDAKAQTDAEAAAKAADDANAEARAALDKECEQAAAAMTAAAKQHEAEWTAELVRRALAQEAAQ